MRVLGFIALTVAVVLGAAGCSGTDSTGPGTAAAVDPADIPIGLEMLATNLDSLVTVEPGSGRGPQADRLADRLALGALPGSADHLGTVATREGPVEIVAYQERMPELPRGVAFCVGEIGPEGGGAGCGGKPTTEPDAGGVTTVQGRSGSLTSITAFGGEDAPFAIVVTEGGAEIGIVTARGWAFAQWPSGWGYPDTITFYDSEANEAFHTSYDM